MMGRDNARQALEPFVGEWRLTATFEDMPPADADARVRFEWLAGERFLVQRWEKSSGEKSGSSRHSFQIPSARLIL